MGRARGRAGPHRSRAVIGHQDVAAIAAELAELLDAPTLARAIADELANRPAPPPRIVSAAELAAILGVSRDVVYERAGELGVLRLGSVLRFELDVALERARTGPAPAAAAPAVRPRARRRPASSATEQLLPIKGRSS